MDKIVVGFSKPKVWKPFAWLIQTAYGTEYSHVFIRMHSNFYDRDLIYQASGTSVNFVGTVHFNDINTVVQEFEIDITETQKKAIIQFAIDNSGKPYGIAEVFGLAIVRIAELMGKVIKNPIRDNRSTYVCSELVSYIIKDCSDIHLPKHPEDMTPKDVYDAMVALKNYQVGFLAQK